VSIRRYSGFTLIELLIVITIIGILASIAYPAYRDSLTKARRSDGQTKMLEIMNALERYYTENNTYVTNLSTLPEYASATVNSDEGFYIVSAAVCGASAITSCVELTGTAQGIQSDDGNLTYNSRGVKLPADKW
jgi:type IV pilus assembly protein PilE